ncbi:auxin-induced protein 15A-like [Rutidosis leptorrhynchoides]|uniref:auxin-induced protein 15A-like n=1 Tax=Rutidosis leptorrhynchoides TaxID=125765 RepID=UPI003A990CF7
MDLVKSDENKGLISKTWERCKSFSGVVVRSKLMIKRAIIERSISLPQIDGHKGKEINNVTKGCFSVYVGPQRQKFVIKAEYANHPLFEAFLVEAESEYGYKNEGPIVLPCDVDDFVKILQQIDDGC